MGVSFSFPAFWVCLSPLFPSAQSPWQCSVALSGLLGVMGSVAGGYARFTRLPPAMNCRPSRAYKFTSVSGNNELAPFKAL